MAAPNVPPKTRSSGGSRTIAIGAGALEDHREQEGADRQGDADQSGRVHGSALLSAREGDDGRGPRSTSSGASVRRGGTRRGPSRRRWRGCRRGTRGSRRAPRRRSRVTTYLVPSTRRRPCRGGPRPARSRSGLSANRSPFRRVTRITERSSWRRAAGPERAWYRQCCHRRVARRALEPNRPGHPIRGDRACAGGPAGGGYCFIWTRSCRIWSDVVITLLFAWKPRWAMIRPVNSWERSTFDISSAPAESVPRPAGAGRADLRVAGVVADARRSCCPTSSRPPGLAKVASASCPIGLAQAVGVDAGDRAVVAERERLAACPCAEPPPVTGVLAIAVLLPPNWVTFDRSATVAGQPGHVAVEANCRPAVGGRGRGAPVAASKSR